MLNDKLVSAILPTTDLARSIEFYQNKLGLRLISQDGYMANFGSGESVLSVYLRGETRADHTVAGWEVDDLAQEMEELKSRGVVFEEYDTPDIKTVDGIANTGGTLAAWFKDPDNNILGIFQTETA